jgi:hypothetical protein
MAVMLYPAEDVGAVLNALTVTVAPVTYVLIDAAGLGADSSRTAPKVLIYVYTYERVSAVTPTVVAKVGAAAGAGTPKL